MHYIQQTVIGPICTSPGCQCAVSNKTRLFSCGANTIDRHWKAKQCFDGNPSPKRVHAQLRERLRYLHTTSIGNNDIAFQHFRVGDEGVTRRKQYHCSHCWIVDKPSKLLRQHCRPAMSDEVEGRKGKCPGTQVNDYVLKNKYNQMVPESFLMAMIAGDSPLRRLQPDLQKDGGRVQIVPLRAIYRYFWVQIVPLLGPNSPFTCYLQVLLGPNSPSLLLLFPQIHICTQDGEPILTSYSKSQYRSN